MLLHIYREGQGQTWRVETDVPIDELKLLDLNLKVFPTSVPEAFKSTGERFFLALESGSFGYQKCEDGWVEIWLDSKRRDALGGPPTL